MAGAQIDFAGDETVDMLRAHRVAVIAGFDECRTRTRQRTSRTE